MSDSREHVPVQEDLEREVYVGPRPFERSERSLFFGRDREISELLSLVTSSRVVLCYAPSGAGKTSLINAGLQPRLEKEGFEVLPSTRVRGLIPEGIDPHNITNLYVFNALLGLAGETKEPAELIDCSMAQYLSTLPHTNDEEGFPSPRILILDQFEELITSYPELWQEREGFFQQVYDALQTDPLLRVLFIMREDFLARIEPFTRLLKPLSQSRFRLDLLGPQGAKAAVVGPLQGTTRHFKEGVVDLLIEELLKVRVETAQGDATEVVGEYVEPVQLQVVCRNLWTSLPPDVQEITQDHLTAYGNVDQALREFYEDCLTEAKTGLRANELNLRQWFENQLVTPAGTRGIVFRDSNSTAGLPNPIVDFLENRHLIRGEWRAGSRWYELTHDRFIAPIQRANEHWRVKRQRQRNRLLAAVGGLVALMLVVWSVILSAQQSTTSQSAVQSTAAASTLVSSVQITAQVQVQAAQEDASLSKSGQLAAQALLADNSNTALLLGIEANQFSDTVEARRSLHKVLSKQGVVDGEFLREFNPEILSPTLLKRLDDHKGPVVSVAFSPDGQRFVSGSVNGTVLLWDFATAKPMGTSLTTRRSSIETVAYSPDGRLVASAGQDAQISLWNASTGELVGTIKAHEGLVTCIAFSPDGKLIASGGMDQHVRIWDVESQRLVNDLKDEDTIASLAWSPDGKVLVWGTFSSTVTFWNSITFETFDTLRIENNPILSIAWSPNSQMLAFGMASEEGPLDSGDVILWDVANRTSVTHPVPDNIVRVRTVTFDPSGTTLAIGRDDGSIVLWDLRSQQILNTIEAHDHRVMSIAFSPDGQYLISGGYEGTIAIWNLQAPTNTIAVSPNGDILAASQGSAISLWDLSKSQTAPMSILAGHTGEILALSFSPDGNTLASSGKDNKIRFWDVNSGQQIGAPISTKSNVLTLQFSTDGSTVAVAGESGRVQLFDPVTQSIRTITEQNGPALKVQFGKDGKTLQIVGKDGTLLTWDLISSKSQAQLLPDSQGGIASVALSQDGQKAAYFQEGAKAFLQNDERAHGIEISAFDESFDPNVNPDGVDFVVITATSGLQKDPGFDGYLKPIQSVPIRGAAHIFSLNQPWQAQADLFLETVKDKGFNFFILYMDVDPSDGSTQFLADAEHWLKYVDDHVDGKVLLQTGSYYLSKFGSAGDWMKDWPLVVSQYPLELDRTGSPFLPQGVEDWRIWNYTEKGKGADFGVGADHILLAVYNGTPLEMSQWLGINAFSIHDQLSGETIHPNQAIQVTGPNGIAFSPNGSYLAAAGDGTVFLLDATSGEEISTLSVGGRTILSLGFLPDSNTLAIGTNEGTVLLWDLAPLKSAKEVASMREIACSQVQQNFTETEWTQYFGDMPRKATCPNAPLP